MDVQVKKMLNPARQIFAVLGNIANNTNLLLGNKFQLDKDDFVSNFHKIVFLGINNIINSNPRLEQIDVIDIDSYLKQFPTHYKIWESNNGAAYLSSAKETAKNELFEHDLETIKKYSLLRKYIDKGIDVTDLYNYKSVDIDEITADAKNIDQMKFSEILDHYTSKVIDVRSEVGEESGDIVKFDIDSDIDELLDKLQNDPEMGYPFVNGYYNTLFRGMRETKFMLRSGDTGTGKTRQDIRDMCNVACTQRYELGKGWIDTGASMPILFISTELNKEELQVLALAYISGINSSEIENGDYDKSARAKLNKAVEIIKKSKMHFVYIEDFSVNDISLLIEEYALKYGIKYCVFDYIQNSAKLSKSLQDAYGHGLREDEIISNLSKKLKMLAEKFDIFILSSTQVNGNAKDDNVNASRDAHALRGGRSTADKIDYGVLTFRVTTQDKHRLRDIIQDNGFSREPNFAHWVYKNRAGYDHIVIWTHMNLGNMREEPLFITDYDYNIMDIPQTDAIITEDDSVNNEIFDF